MTYEECLDKYPILKTVSQIEMVHLPRNARNANDLDFVNCILIVLGGKKK